MDHCISSYFRLFRSPDNFGQVGWQSKALTYCGKAKVTYQKDRLYTGTAKILASVGQGQARVGYEKFRLQPTKSQGNQDKYQKN